MKLARLGKCVTVGKFSDKASNIVPVERIPNLVTIFPHMLSLAHKSQNGRRKPAMKIFISDILIPPDAEFQWDCNGGYHFSISALVLAQFAFYYIAI